VDAAQWEQLNPARGDASPKAATLWGDRGAAVPTGFLLHPVDGFESPPHIHNVTYRAVVIRGLIHNDDPKAARMWMPSGAFWTQPKGEVHITAAKGTDTLAYVEIDQGPYLVRPAAQAFDSGERPVNVDPSNLVWLAAGPTTAHIAYVWGNPADDAPSGALLKLPAGFKGMIVHGQGALRAVVMRGVVTHGTQTLKPGSFFAADAASVHSVDCATAPCWIYTRTEGALQLLPR
jgi:hypothetical protein